VILLRVLLACTKDVASMNIRERLLEHAGWNMVSEFGGWPVHRLGPSLLFVKEGTHLYLDHVDREIADHIQSELPSDVHPEGDRPLDLLVFLSKHRSETGLDSLTVHTPGNLGDALYGGRPRSLPPSAPCQATAALRTLYSIKKEMGLTDRTSFEVTHHGPTLDSPCFFIEIGSGPERWEEPAPASAIARTLMAPDTYIDSDAPVCIGVGGGHYAPRFTDLALRGKVAMGHMVPDHAIGEGQDLDAMIGLAAGSTPGVSNLIYHRTKANLDHEDRVRDVSRTYGLEFIVA